MFYGIVVNKESESGDKNNKSHELLTKRNCFPKGTLSP